MADILLINPAYYEDIFSNSKVCSAISRGTTPLNLLTIAAPLLKSGHRVKILDLNNIEYPDNSLAKVMKEFRPQFVGITSTTPLIKKIYKITERIKEISKNTIVIAGGPHPSALPEEVLLESRIDCVVRGEGDLVFKDIVENGINQNISNIFFKKNGLVVSSKEQGNFISDLDSLPFPAYEILDIKKYYQPRISSRKAPLGYLETSRGCYGRCIFCNKNIHGFKMRMKSSKRVVDEMQRMIGLGFRELQIIDDIFTADMNRAYAICDDIIKRRLKFPWYPRGGIRVDRVTLDLLKIMKRAGCYRIPFGVESGSQRILNLINKNITLDQVKRAVDLAKSSGLEVECYFMLGLPTETEKDLKETINFAIGLNPDYAKFAITIPLPGTQMFEMMHAKGQIKTKDWAKYNFSASAKELYDHDSLSWELLGKYYDISHRRFYFRPEYISKMVFKTIRDGTFLAHIKGFLKTRW